MEVATVMAAPWSSRIKYLGIVNGYNGPYFFGRSEFETYYKVN